MRKFLLAMGVLALCAAGARAQRIEVFTGLSYGQFNPGANLTQSIAEFGRHFSMPGVEASGQLNLHSYLGVVADVSFYGGTGDIGGAFADHARIYNYLAGPQVTARHIGPFNVFVRGLAGTTHAQVSFTNTGFIPGGGGGTCANGQSTPNCTQKETRFAWGAGGGIDLNASDHISLRLIQIDYLRNAFTNCVGGFNQTTSSCAAQAGRQDNYRAAAGFVWHF